MDFIDKVKLKIVAGSGGDGVVAFRRELYVPKGGPSGGDGGDGGNIFFIGDSGLSTLSNLYFKKEVHGFNGHSGRNKNMHGQKGKDLYLKVPLGTIVTDIKTNQIIADITANKGEYLICSGGKGGLGNARFANSRNRVPTIFEAGDLGEIKDVICELKILADVGLVGLPNAGKSTLLSVISNKKPAIGNYSFTTLKPTLGVVAVNNQDSFVAADLPGLILGASQGKGLGFEFLRHIERCNIILHILDISGNYGQEDVVKNYQTIRKELKMFGHGLKEKKEIVIANKIDILEYKKNILLLKKYLPKTQIIEISSLKKINLNSLKLKVFNEIKKYKFNNINNTFLSSFDETKKDYRIYKYTPEFDEISLKQIKPNYWKIISSELDYLIFKYPFTTIDNWHLINYRLQKMKVINLISKSKIKDNDLIEIGGKEFLWKNNTLLRN